MPPPLPRCSGWAHSSLKLAHPYQPSPKPLSGRPAHRPFRGLLGVHSRCGLHTRAVTKIVTVIRRLQTFRRLHACSGCFRLERSPGGPCTHWKSAALSRRTWIADLRQSRDEGLGRADSGRPRRAITTEGSTLTNPPFPTGEGTIIPQYRPLRLQASPNSTSSSSSPPQRSEEGYWSMRGARRGEVARRFRPFGWRRGSAHVEINGKQRNCARFLALVRRRRNPCSRQ